MKHLLYVIFVLLVCSLNAQEIKLLHINSKWNQSNNFDLKGIKNCTVQYALLEDQVPSVKSKIKSVPTIILLDKNGKPRGQWIAGLSFKIIASKEEIQDRINVIYKEK
jgi:hypothetical protein